MKILENMKDAIIDFDDRLTYIMFKDNIKAQIIFSLGYAFNNRIIISF